MTKLGLLNDRVRAVLLKDWDPIGIADVPQAQDEYDAYVPQVARLVAGGRSTVELSEYLLHLETDVLGLLGDRERARAVAGKLAEIEWA